MLSQLGNFTKLLSYAVGEALQCIPDREKNCKKGGGNSIYSSSHPTSRDRKSLFFFLSPFLSSAWDYFFSTVHYSPHETTVKICEKRRELQQRMRIYVLYTGVSFMTTQSNETIITYTTNYLRYKSLHLHSKVYSMVTPVKT